MAFDRAAAKAAGYTDEEIDAYLREQAGQAAPVSPDSMNVEPPPPTTEVRETGGAAPAVATAGTAVLNIAAPAAGGIAAYKLGEKLVKGLTNRSAPAQGPGPVDLRPSMQSAAKKIPINTAPSTSSILGPNGQPLARPIAPTPAPAAPAPAAPQGPSVFDKANQIVRNIALDKVIKGGLGVAAAVTPGNVGQNYPFPQSGPLRGSEINPATGRPWTQQELAQYRAQYGG